MAAVLEQQYHVVAYDLPGFGLTGPVQYARAYDMDQQARFALRLMDALNLPRFSGCWSLLTRQIYFNA